MLRAQNLSADVRTMRRLDELSWHVMDAMADDWESIVQIRPHVMRFCGATPDRRILDILREVHRFELVRIMDADGYRTDEFPEDPHEHWFSMTEVGRDLWDAEGPKYRGHE